MNISFVPSRICLVVAAIATVLLFSGCSLFYPRGPGRFAIRVEADKSIADHGMQVDFVADPRISRERWESCEINEYWPDGQFRQDAKPITLMFGPGLPPSQTIELTNAVYKAWLERKPSFAVLIKDDPSHLDNPGKDDQRRLFLSLERRAWKGHPNELKVLIQESGMKADTQKSVETK